MSAPFHLGERGADVFPTWPTTLDGVPERKEGEGWVWSGEDEEGEERATAAGGDKRARTQ